MRHRLRLGGLNQNALTYRITIFMVAIKQGTESKNGKTRLESVKLDSFYR